jgi:L-2-hydroxyglutarate oxidase LhgO
MYPAPPVTSILTFLCLPLVYTVAFDEGMNTTHDLAIIGAGIVGLATGLQISAAFPRLRILVLEKEDHVGAHQTGRNSGVIHSGIYYRPGSLKAQLCVQGAAAMVAFCQTHEIPMDICGKIVVATSKDQIPQLQELQRRAEQNGVPGVVLIGPEQVRELEPHATAEAALHVPGTGITDYLLVARKYAETILAAGGQIQTRAEVQAIHDSQSCFNLETSQGTFTAKFLVNCAGLHSDRVARMTKADIEFQIVPFRGEYYELLPGYRQLVRGLIYPVPDPRFPFLGVHFTRRISGGIEAGPNAVLAFHREGYSKLDFNLRDLMETASFSGFWKMAGKYWRTGTQEMYRSFSKASFVRGLQKLVPEVQSSHLTPAGSGVRAQALDRNGALLDDFHFVQQGRALHVCNVPSPAATASLLIGKTVAQMAAGQFGFR